ncbi:hypothetical protein MRX96_010627 [Rhipicephalus microplus]
METLTSLLKTRSPESIRVPRLAYDARAAEAFLTALATCPSFLAGAECVRVIASSLERVYRHHALLEELAEAEDVSVDELVAKRRPRVKAFENMYDFMRIAGVVNDRVSRVDPRSRLAYDARAAEAFLTALATCPSVSESFAVWDTTRRNFGLVASASQFLAGAECVRVIASSLERVYRHRALLEELAEAEDVSVDELVAKLRPRVKAFESMYDFMRIAGVVNDRD